MSNDEILARIFWDVGNAEEAIGPDNLMITWIYADIDTIIDCYSEPPKEE